MSISHISHSQPQAPCLPEPPAELKQHSLRLQQRLLARIEKSGPLPFAEFMEASLYEPGLGYYSAGLHKFGATGDFITAPELGSLFARCLAQSFSAVAKTLSARDGHYNLLEIGAGSGALCVDLLKQLDELPETYFILERSADLRARQRQHLQQHCPQWLEIVQWLDAPPNNFRGICYANEVIDALPVERFRIHAGAIEQQVLGLARGQLQLGWQQASKKIIVAVRELEESLGQPFAEGYESELNLLARPWLQGLLETMQSGLLLLSDYGYPASEYYLPDRNQGTLICHYRHHAHTDPLFWPGLQDLTAFVNFTAVAEAGDDVKGWELAGYTSQADFLFNSGLVELLQGKAEASLEQQLRLSAEIKVLTLPAEMGTRFQFIGFSRDIGTAQIAGFNGNSWSHRL